jgi:hypothetical protein
VSGTSNVKHVLAFVGDLIPPVTAKTRATAQAGSGKGRFYKPLSKEFRRDGFAYKQVARQGNAAIYEQRWTGCAEPSVCNEVIRVRYRDGFHIGGRFVEPAEVYPNSEAWGVDGFTFTDRDGAFAKLREVVASPNPIARFKQEEADRTEKSPT